MTSCQWVYLCAFSLRRFTYKECFPFYYFYTHRCDKFRLFLKCSVLSSLQFYKQNGCTASENAKIQVAESDSQI
jgi:hypothetical protein